MNAMEQAQTKHWDELSTTAGQLLSNIQKVEKLGLINQSIIVEPVNPFLSNCLLEHLKGEFDNLASWDEIKDNRQAGYILSLISARGTFEGTTCGICQAWKPQVKTMLTIDAVKEFLESHRARGSSPQTISLYESVLNRFANEFEYLPTHPQDIERYIMPYHGNTKGSYFSIIEILYKFHKERHGITNPTEQMPRIRVPKKVIESLTPEELQRLFSQPLSKRDRAILLVMAGCGLRVGEVIGLKFRDIEEHTLKVETGKSGGRVLPLLDEIRDALLALKDGHKGDDSIFWSRLNKPISTEVGYLGIIRKVFKSAGITGKRASPHTLRHTCATLWEGDAPTLQRMLGHSNLNTTQGYVHLQTNEMVERNLKYNPLLSLLNGNLDKHQDLLTSSQSTGSYG